jgi:hypothetical protein
MYLCRLLFLSEFVSYPGFSFEIVFHATQIPARFLPISFNKYIVYILLTVINTKTMFPNKEWLMPLDSNLGSFNYMSCVLASPFLVLHITYNGNHIGKMASFVYLKYKMAS